MNGSLSITVTDFQVVRLLTYIDAKDLFFEFYRYVIVIQHDISNTSMINPLFRDFFWFST